jgi:peptidyl-tRNA hydrolase ICT1
VRLDLSAASKEQNGLPNMPWNVIRYLTSKSPYYVASSHSLLISSMKTRTQQGNLQDALEKMQSHVQFVLSQDIRGETSESQKKRVRSLIAKDKVKTRKFKDKRGAVKSGRKAVIAD